MHDNPTTAATTLLVLVPPKYAVRVDRHRPRRPAATALLSALAMRMPSPATVDVFDRRALGHAGGRRCPHALQAQVSYLRGASSR